jgi:hypothetical protein
LEQAGLEWQLFDSPEDFVGAIQNFVFFLGSPSKLTSANPTKFE